MVIPYCLRSTRSLRHHVVIRTSTSFSSRPFRGTHATVTLSSLLPKEPNVIVPIISTSPGHGYGAIQRRAFTAYGVRRSERKSSPPESPPPQKPKLREQLRERLKAVQSHENIYTIPNFLTASRLIAAPVIGYLILHDQHVWAVSLFAYAGITDLLDGWIARKWKLQTVIGSVVDPMADKTLMTVLVGCLAINGALPLPLATIILGRDVSLAIAAIYYRWASLPQPKTLARYWDFSLPSAEVHPTTVSKFNTFLQLLLIGYTLMLPLLPPPDILASPQTLGEVGDVMGGGADSWDGFTRLFQAVVASTTVWSGMSYAFNRSAVRILGDNEVLKRKQGFRGRAIVGGSFAVFIAVAAWLWVERPSVKSQKVVEGGDEK